MQAFRVNLKPSKYIQILIIILHVISILFIPFYFSFWYALILILALIISWIFAHYINSSNYSYFVHTIEIRPDEQAIIYFQNNREPAQILSNSLLGKYILVLCWQTENGLKINQAIIFDMTNKDDYRKLSVWARCQ